MAGGGRSRRNAARTQTDTNKQTGQKRSWVTFDERFKLSATLSAAVGLQLETKAKGLKVRVEDVLGSRSRAEVHPGAGGSQTGVPSSLSGALLCSSVTLTLTQ